MAYPVSGCIGTYRYLIGKGWIIRQDIYDASLVLRL